MLGTLNRLSVTRVTVSPGRSTRTETSGRPGNRVSTRQPTKRPRATLGSARTCCRNRRQRLARPELRHALGHAQRQPMRQPTLRRFSNRPQPPSPQRNQARVRGTFANIGRPMHRQRLVALDRDRSPQPVHAQPPRQRIGLCRLAIDQHIVAVRPRMKSNSALPCGVSSPAHTGSGPTTSLVTSPCRNPRTSLARKAQQARGREGWCAGGGSWHAA